MKGTSQTITYDVRGNVVKTRKSVHTPEEDTYFSQHSPLRNDGKLRDGLGTRQEKLRKEERKKQAPLTAAIDEKNKRSKGYERGPVVRQMFQDGDFCPEANHNRRMTVELICCTDEEIDNWLEKRKQGISSDKKDKTKPLAVLVGMQEDQTCVYRSKICTPLLCPKSLSKPALSKNGNKESAAAMAELIREQSKTDPIGALLSALFGDELAQHNNFGEVQVFFPNEAVGRDFDELAQAAENGEDILNHPSFERVKKGLRNGKKMDMKELFMGTGDAGSDPLSVVNVKDGMSIREILEKTLGKRGCLMKNLGWWNYEFCYGNRIRQYHSNNFIDSNTGKTTQIIETEHQLGVYANSGNDITDYPNDDEHLHVVNATGANKADWGVGRRKGPTTHIGEPSKNERQRGGNGAVYVQEYSHGDTCDQEDVAESVIKGGNVIHGSVERSSTVRFSCGKRSELIGIKEDSTCHYILDVTVPELCQHELFRAPVTKTHVVKCLPV